MTLTILVAGCSLAVSIGGGLVDRKRPFTLLRVGGTPLGTLYRVVLLEALLPLVGARGGGRRHRLRHVGPGGAADRASPARRYRRWRARTTRRSASAWPWPWPSSAITLPLLGRMTTPASARFE